MGQNVFNTEIIAKLPDLLKQHTKETLCSYDLNETMNDSYSSFWLEKSDYLRLKNLEFGYTFRQAELAKVGISSIRVYFAGSNLLTFTPLKNWDPEKSSGDTRNDVHPNMRTYSFGLNIQF